MSLKVSIVTQHNTKWMNNLLYETSGSAGGLSYCTSRTIFVYLRFKSLQIGI